MACCVLLAGLIALVLACKARIFGNSRRSGANVLRWRLKKEKAHDI